MFFGSGGIQQRYFTYDLELRLGHSLAVLRVALTLLLCLGSLNGRVVSEKFLIFSSVATRCPAK